MQLKFLFAPLSSALILCSSLGASAQVAPAAFINGRSIGVGVGFSDYSLDYGQGRRMAGPVARASVGIFHGFGVDVSARSILLFKPDSLTRMRQNTFLAGAYYEVPRAWRVRPFVRFAGGLGTIDFPSRDPRYTHDSYTVYAPSAGVEMPLVHNLYLRADYEYQYWKRYHGPRDLNPQGVTVGLTYYLSGMRPHRFRRNQTNE